MNSRLVLVTGASGFLASHIVQQLLQEGHRVRGTVRSLKNEGKVQPLQELCPEAEHQLELVEADLLQAESWIEAMKDCTYVIHTASPFPRENPTDEDEVIKPALEGTMSILKACQQAKIKRLVLTSSSLAVFDDSISEAEKVYSEADWSDIEKVTMPYTKSKIMAEKAAWDFVKQLPEEEKFELAVINPTYIMGPVLSNNECTSLEVCKRLLERDMIALPKLFLNMADVREVAAAHIKAMILPEAVGNRHLVFSHGMWLKEIAQVISAEFKPQGYKIPSMNCPYPALWLMSLFDKTIKMILPNIGKATKIDNTRMKETLGIDPRDPKETIIDMCYSMIEMGLVKKTKKYRGPHGEEAKADETEAAGTAAQNEIEGQKTSDENKEEKEETEKAKETPDPTEVQNDEEPSKAATENQAEKEVVVEDTVKVESSPVEETNDVSHQDTEGTKQVDGAQDEVSEKQETSPPEKLESEKEETTEKEIAADENGPDGPPDTAEEVKKDETANGLESPQVPKEGESVDEIKGDAPKTEDAGNVVNGEKEEKKE